MPWRECTCRMYVQSREGLLSTYRRLLEAAAAEPSHDVKSSNTSGNETFGEQ